MRVYAVYVGETRKFHYFQLLQDDKRVVGTIYYRKDAPLPANQLVQIVNPNDECWINMVRELRDRARNGSKSKQKLTKILEEKGCV